jgi:hypothetical protein
MPETSTQARPSTVVERIATKLSAISTFSPSSDPQSRPSRFEQRLEAGRTNQVQPEFYDGRRDAPFDAEALFCYLVEQVKLEHAVGMNGVCETYEATVGQLPVDARRNAQQRFAAAPISDAPHGDDVQRLAAVDMLVDALATYSHDLEDDGTEDVVVAASAGET